MDRHEPLRERDTAVLEDRPDQHGELLAARRALPDAPRRFLAGTRLARPILGGEEVGVVDGAAMRADRAFRPADALDQLPGFRLVREVLR